MNTGSAPQQDAGLPTFEAVLAILVIIITLSAMRLSLFLWPEPPRAELLTAREMRQDLFVLRREIESHSAFLSLDHQSKLERIDSQIKALAARYPDQIPARVFGAEVLKILNLLQDPGISTSEEAEFGLRLPFILRAMENAWLALNADLQPFNPDFPFVSHIDDIPIARWQEAAQSFLPGASRYSLSEQSRWLERVGLLRTELGIKASTDVRLTLFNQDGQSIRQVHALLPPAPEFTPPPGFRISPIAQHSMMVTVGDLDELEHNRGNRQALQQAMQSRLLVVDLRRARGQSPALLTLLAAYGDTETDLLGFARYRVSATKRNDYLGTTAYRAVGNGPNLVEDEAHIRFGQWFARSQSQGDKVKGQLALLAGPGCRQECEWIIHSAKAWPRAIIIGEDTLGDLGKLHQFRLPNLRQSFFFSSSLAYAKDGSLISGVGSSPDIWVAGQENFDAPGLLALIGELTELPTPPTDISPNGAEATETQYDSGTSSNTEETSANTEMTPHASDAVSESTSAASPALSSKSQTSVSSQQTD
ncbi:hypothetical protein [Shewanella sp.]|uniref:hypothetical protein n=1 Tax=Shewanella sp. TaxID=50422 RepID=UPI00356A786F